jgi:glycosyltransferase involved in cell wall biosynthesis
VPDLGTYINRAKVVIVPLRCGACISMKVSLALALGRPRIATQHDTRSFDVEHGKHFLTADASEEFARQVDALLNDAPMRARPANERRTFARRRYSPDAVFQGLRDLVTRVV